ncbi:MAG: putative DNA binding domain-containing protein, partial [Anaerolineae bacterium]|nr:putative DNA binding domain-containing protein [Anaerolineae bacterium]
MNEETFARLLQQREGETLDFKQELPGSSDLAVLISAFYNTRGGTIIIGVDNQRRPVGVDRPQSVEAGIVNIIRDRLDLDVLPTIEIVAYQGQEFVAVTCPRGPYPPYFVRGEPRPYVRVGSSNRLATHAEIRHLYLLSGEVSYETLPCRGATLTDFSAALIGRYRERRNRHTAGALDLSDEELLRNLGCVVEEEGRLLPTNAGVLLFCEDPYRFLRQNEITCAQFKGTDMLRTIDRKDLRGPLPGLVMAAEQFLYRHIRIGHEVIGFEGIDYWEYPREAMREALINAAIHRDYSIAGGRIRIFLFDDRIEFYSPGDLLPGVTVEKMQRLESQSKLRNLVIVEVFRDLGGFIEKMGTGIQRMARAMEEHGLLRPHFEELGGEFRVTLIGPGDRFMEKEAVPEWMRGLNERQVTAMEYVARQGKITNREYQALFGVARGTALLDLNS